MLYEIDQRDMLSSDAVRHLTIEKDLPPEERRLAVRLIYGVLERKLTLDDLLSQVSKTPLSKLDPYLHMVLRTALYQLIYMDRIPESAAVNEAVEMAKKKGRHLSGFVNGVLRQFLRTRQTLKTPERYRPSNETRYLSVAYSHPEWLVKRWQACFGTAFCEALLDANNQLPPLTLRVNRLRAEVSQVQNALEKAGVPAEQSKFLDYALIVPPGQDAVIHEWPSFTAGEIYVQDLASMLVTEVLDPMSGERVLDLCAAPGSKTTHMAEKMNDHGWITARDVSDKKLEKIKENARRLGLSIIHPEVWDGLKPDPDGYDAYDRVLLDAPCSGLGIIRRKPEIRYRRQPEDLTALTELQSQLLEQAGAYVRPGGVLVYSTCSVDPSENEDQVRRFLSRHLDFEMVHTPWSDEDGCIRRYPNVHHTDGFFIAKLKRSES